MELCEKTFVKYVEENFNSFLDKNIYNETIIDDIKKFLKILYYECPVIFRPGYFASILNIIINSDLNNANTISAIKLVHEYGTKFKINYCNESNKIAHRLFNKELLLLLIKCEYKFSSDFKNITDPDLYNILNDKKLLGNDTKRNIFMNLADTDPTNVIINIIISDPDIKKICNRINYYIRFSQDLEINIFKKILMNIDFINCRTLKYMLYRNRFHNNIDKYELIIKYIVDKKRSNGAIGCLKIKYEIRAIVSDQLYSFLTVLNKLLKVSEDDLLYAINYCFKKKWVAGIRYLLSDDQQYVTDDYSVIYNRSELLLKLDSNEEMKYLRNRLLFKFIVNSP